MRDTARELADSLHLLSLDKAVLEAASMLRGSSTIRQDVEQVYGCV